MSESKLDLPRIKDVREENGFLYFTVSSCNVSVINSIRRTILSDIPVVCFKTEPHNEVDDKLESTIIYNNTTILTNEIIKQRLGCIPIHLKVTEKMLIENLVVELDVVNKSDNMLYVTSNDFKIKEVATNNYLKDAAVKKIFPPNKLTNDFILFNRLKPRISKHQEGEKLKLISKLHINTSKENSQCNVCSTIGYENTIDNVKSNEAWMIYQDKLRAESKSTKEISDIEKNWFNHNAKRYFTENSFNFNLETIGIYTNQELIKIACNILIKRMENLKKMVQENKLEIRNDTINTKYSFDIILPNISYTIGKMLEYLLHDRYFNKTKTFAYVGFIKKHPHDDYSIIRVVFKSGDNSNIDNIKTLLVTCINYSQEIYKHIDDSFI
jgi:DNA-directed RNA polymerase alpha subunit